MVNTFLDAFLVAGKPANSPCWSPWKRKAGNLHAENLSSNYYGHPSIHPSRTGLLDTYQTINVYFEDQPGCRQPYDL